MQHPWLDCNKCSYRMNLQNNTNYALQSFLAIQKTWSHLCEVQEVYIINKITNICIIINSSEKQEIQSPQVHFICIAYWGFSFSLIFYQFFLFFPMSLTFSSCPRPVGTLSNPESKASQQCHMLHRHHYMKSYGQSTLSHTQYTVFIILTSKLLWMLITWQDTIRLCIINSIHHLKQSAHIWMVWKDVMLENPQDSCIQYAAELYLKLNVHGLPMTNHATRMFTKFHLNISVKKLAYTVSTILQPNKHLIN